MQNRSAFYLMENVEEAIRLELKTAPEAVRRQALWCGLKPGLRVLDAGCGIGKTTAILHEMIQPGGEILGIDFSKERIDYARQHYGRKPGLDFRVHDLRESLKTSGPFDLIWIRFVLEYFRAESAAIVRNLTSCLAPGGYLCLIDLDHNCLSHYEMPPDMERMLFGIISVLEEKYNFDPYAGRKLYAYLYDQNYTEIELDLVAHHLFYGKIKEADVFNWLKKGHVISSKTKDLFGEYAGGFDAFLADFKKFFLDPRRFTYTPLILCKGMKPLPS
ncbi:MAG: methyltransferase domain-containing protein [Desulfobacterales bacterium]